MKKPGKAALARARALYDEGRAPLHEIALGLKLSAAAFRAFRKTENWPPRGVQVLPQPKRTRAPQEPPPEAGGEESLDTRPLERRLVRALRREIARAETEIENASHPGAERKARILGLLVKTLGDLRRLDATDKANAQKAAPDATEEQPPRDLPPRDLAALRQALVERLEELRGEREPD